MSKQNKIEEIDDIATNRNRLDSAASEIRGRLLRGTDPDISSILGILAQSVAADRATLCLYPVDSKIHCDPNKKELIVWSGDGKEFATVGTDHRPASFGDWLSGKIMEGNPFFYSSLEELPEAASSEKEWLGTSGVMSMAGFPFRSWDSSYLGFIGLYWTRDNYTCSGIEKQSLTMMSELIASYYGRMKAEVLARKSENRFRTLIQKSSDIITVLDDKLTILYVSPSVERILGYKTEELQGQNALQFVHSDDQVHVGETFKQVLESSMEERTVEHQFKHKKGHWVYLESVGTNLIQDPEVGGVVVNSRDINYRKQTERDLIHARDAAEEMNRVKTALLANMSHEMRTPLTGILGFASILESDLEDDELREMARRINVSGRRLLETIESILDLAKLESEKVEIRPVKINIVDEIQRALDIHAASAQRKGLKLSLQSGMKELHVDVDRQLFNRIMYSLLSNALKYTETGEVTVHLSKMRDHKESFIQVDVQDTGLGISPEFIPKVFDEFQQESTGLSRKFEGSGLGLTITRKLIEMMNGIIFVSSTKGEGSIFSFRLPVNIEEGQGSGNEQLDSGNAMQSNPSRILLVEDDYDSSAITRFYLGQEYDIEITDSGEKAVEMLRKEEFHLVIMDISLGAGMDGVSTLKTMKEKSLLDDTPVIALTAHALSGDADYYMDNGFTGYLSKPFKKVELQDLVEKHIRR